ncbi:YeiH family protein [Nocardia arizonensis]|uniref:YeiH family protein n=1 Tax=Nocardia arizonensis TaxID=1141647 RepID=UPI0006D0E79B|nr:putative sulfate exporter family transporter [Nocardia arizonensis]
MTITRRYGPGLALAALIATAATIIGGALPAVGVPMLALAGGALSGLLLRRSALGADAVDPGLTMARGRLLGTAIVLLGLGLPFGSVVSVGSRTAGVLIGTLIIGAVAAVLVGRLLALDPESATLVAAGTTICGASAIAAVTAVMKPDRDRVGYALTTIFVFNIVAVLVFPPIGHLLGLSQEAFGLWAGTAINDTSSVLAAGVVYGGVAAHFAVVVKLVRSLMIVPLCLGLQLSSRRRDDRPLWRSFPLFVVLFVAASALAGLGLVPANWTPPLARLSAWLIAAVLAAVGTGLSWARLREAGAGPLLYGGVLAVVLAVGSLALQSAFGWR